MCCVFMTTSRVTLGPISVSENPLVLERGAYFLSHPPCRVFRRGASRARRTGACASTPRRGSPTGWAPTGCVTKSRPPPPRWCCGRTGCTSIWGGSKSSTRRWSRRTSRCTRGTTWATARAGRAARRGTSSRAGSTPSSRTPCSSPGARRDRREALAKQNTAHPTRGFVSSRASRFFHIISSL